MDRRDALTRSAEHYRRKLEAVAGRILRDRKEAEDIVSDSVVALLEKGPDDAERALPWLLTTTRNRALNRRRDLSRATLGVPDVAQDDEQTSPTDDPRMAELLTAALARMPARYRDAATLRFVDGCTPDEIAITLGTSASQARVVVHRAARRLREEVVTELARFHGAPDDCKRTILRGLSNGGLRVHRDCDPCTSLSDEITAMVANGMLPVGGSLASFVSGFGARVAQIVPAKITHDPSFERIGLALTALATSLAMAATPSPVIPGSHRARIDAPRSQPASLANAGVQRGRATVAAARDAAATRTAIADDAGDDSPLGRAALPARLQLPDPLRDATDDRSTDIRMLTVATGRDRTGRADRLLLTIRLDAAPRAYDSYYVDLAFGAGCTASTSVFMSSATTPEGTTEVKCSPGGDTQVDPASARTVATETTVKGTSIAISVPFGKGAHQPAGFLGSGTRLHHIIGSSYGSPSSPTDTAVGPAPVTAVSDVVPNSGEGGRYTIS